MMAKFTKKLRQEIIDDYMRTSGANWFDASAFLAYVHDTGPDHPAYGWFSWDDAQAAHEHRLNEARAFVRGLAIRFEVQLVEHGVGRIVTREAPAFVSPVDKRSDGGGYYRTDPDDREHVAELGRQAATNLAWFMRRFAAPLAAVGANLVELEDLRARLASLGAEHDEEVAAE